MDEELGRLEAGAHSADIDDALLGRFENLEEVGDGAAIAFDEPDRVIGLGCNTLRHIGNEGLVELVHGGKRGRRMAGRDAQIEVVGNSRRGCGRCGDGDDAGGCNSLKMLTC